MLNYKINAQGVPPPPLCPPNAIIPPNRLYLIIAKRRGGMGGRAQSPPSSYQNFVFHIIANRNSTEPENGTLYYFDTHK
jgi:hypothetical protein